MKRIILFVSSLLLLIGLQCSRPASTTGEATIATSIFPVYDWSRILLGSQANIINILPPGANPHHFEPTPGVARQLQHVRLFIGMDPHLDGWVSPLLPKGVQIVYLSKVFEQTNDSHYHDDNPHYWLSVKNARAMVEALSQTLCNHDPEQCDTITSRTSVYLEKLNQVDSDIAALFNGLKNRTFFQWHAAWNYFAEDYNLTIAGTLSQGHGDTPSIKKLANLISLAKSQSISVVVQGLHEQHSETALFAKETNAFLLTLDTLGNPEVESKSSYVRLMKQNASILANGLRQKP